MIATVLWLAASLAFRFYVVNFGSYDETYGALGAIILLMLWFYLTGFAIIIGAELNAEIEHASPWGKAPGEKVPGAKKKIGIAAARAYRAACRTDVVPQEAPRLRDPGTSAEAERRNRLGMLVRLAILAIGLVGVRRNPASGSSKRAPSS